jgi:NADPH2:quinone reductase
VRCLAKACPGWELNVGENVAAMMGGMERAINGSYEEYARVPASSVVAIDS